MHHKRKRPRKASCGLCKPHKTEGNCPRHKDMRLGNLRRYLSGSDQLRCQEIKGGCRPGMGIIGSSHKTVWIKRKGRANGSADPSLIASAGCQYIRGHQQKPSDRLNLCAS